jgi:hypothetical protein
MDEPKKEFVLKIRTTPSATPAAYRNLRRLLKALLRSFGFKCVSIEEAKEPTGKSDENRR